MNPFTKKLLIFIKNLIYIITTFVASIVASIFVFIVLIILITVIADMKNPYLSQKDICEIVLENQDDLEMIVDDLRSYDVPQVYVNKENIRTYINLVRLPDGRYMLGDEGPDFSTSEEMKRLMKELKVDNIDFSLLDEVEIVTFEVNNSWMKGFYWVDPDTPTMQAYNSQHHDLTPSGEGWEYIAHDDRYYTEKICDHWYYYVVKT